MGKYVWPCPGYSRMSSDYGYRIHPISGDRKFHDGIDLAAPSGTDILACGAGTVTVSGWNSGGYGNYIRIDHGGGLESFYGHCKALYVKAGATVKAGQRIAAVGTTGASTGNHLHFGMHRNGSSVNPLSYVSAKDTTANYTGSSTSTSTENRVRAKFTAYYPADNAMEGGFYDAQGNLLDPSKRTMAAPKSVPFGTQVTIIGTGTSRDGTTYTVNDRGGAITVENGVYHFDILMGTAAECNSWGVKYGYAILGGTGAAGTGGGGGTTTAETEKKEITTVVVQSVTGLSAVQKNQLLDLPPHLTNGMELRIQNDKIYVPCVAGEVKLERSRKGEPAKLTFTVMKDAILNFQEGNPVTLHWNGMPAFAGFVFEKSRQDLEQIKVIAYDQMRYLKNEDTLSYENKTYAELLRMLAADYGLKCGQITDTKYKIPHRLEEGTLLDMLQTASDLTVVATGKLYVLYDAFGALTLVGLDTMRMDSYVVDADTAQSFDYTSTIDKGVYNKIKLAVDNGDTGVRETYVYNDTGSQAVWGQLQYYEKLDEDTDPALLAEKAKALLAYYNRKNRSLKVKGAIGDINVRGGTLLAVFLNIGDIIVRNYMCVESVTHHFVDGLHTMDLTLAGGEFQA